MANIHRPVLNVPFSEGFILLRIFVLFWIKNHKILIWRLEYGLTRAHFKFKVFIFEFEGCLFTKLLLSKYLALFQFSLKSLQVQSTPNHFECSVICWTFQCGQQYWNNDMSKQWCSFTEINLFLSRSIKEKESHRKREDIASEMCIEGKSIHSWEKICSTEEKKHGRVLRPFRRLNSIRQSDYAENHKCNSTFQAMFYLKHWTHSGK